MASFVVFGCNMGCAHIPECLTVRDKEPTEPEKLPKRTPKATTCAALGEFQLKTAMQPDCDKQRGQLLQDEARRSFQRALSIDKKCTEGYLGLARLYQVRGESDRALETLQTGIKEIPKESILHFELGLYHARAKDWKNATESLSAALKLDKENPRYISTLGFALAKAGRYDESFAVFKTGAGGVPQAHYNIARVLQHENAPEECKKHLYIALNMKPDFSQARELLDEVEAGKPNQNAVQTVGFEQDNGVLELK